MEENILQPQPVQPQPAPQPAKPEKKADDEFSIAWHLKVLAGIYVVLGIFFIILKVTLK
jgi:hypothetical protein